MVDWLKVYKLAPRVVVMIVNECREQPDVDSFNIRVEARVLGHTITASYLQRLETKEAVDAAFATLGRENALHWLRNQHIGWNGGAAHA